MSRFIPGKKIAGNSGMTGWNDFYDKVLFRRVIPVSLKIIITIFNTNEIRNSKIL
jgi:hypothetical protein